MSTFSSGSGISELVEALENRQFIGNFTSKQYVSRLNQYKDVIILQENETELIDDMCGLGQRIVDCGYRTWFGHEYTEANIHCIHVEVIDGDNTLTTPITFGEYRFEVAALQSTLDVIEMKIRPISPIARSGSIFADTTIATFIANHQYVGEWLLTADVWAVETSRAIGQTLSRFYHDDVNWANAKQCAMLFGMLCIYAVNGSVDFVKWLGDFSIRFIYAVDKLLNTAKPIIFAILNFCGKIIGGMYLLLAMMWRDSFGHPTHGRNSVNRSRPAIQPYEWNGTRSSKPRYTNRNRDGAFSWK